MSSFEKKKRRQPHLEIPKAVTESQAVISWGEEFLHRAHELGHEIEEHVRRLMDDSTQKVSGPSQTEPNNHFSNSHAEDELVRSKVPVDNYRQDG